MTDKDALRQLLRWKRGQIDPSELGIPRRTGRGRRSPGLSQAQVAQALFVTERTYGHLERGEMPAPSQGFLDSVCKVLRLEEGERTALYIYALGYEPPTPLDPTSGTSVAPAWQKAVNEVTGQPCYINDVAWNLLAYNDDFVSIFPQVEGEAPRVPEQNLIRWMLLREDAREHHLVDWEEQWAGPVAAQLRAAVATHPQNKDLQQLHEEVSEDPVSGPIYRTHNVAFRHPDGQTRIMRHPGYSGPHSDLSPRDKCCERHVPSQRGLVTMCAAEPCMSPGARFFFLVFQPASP
ncbi:helix-turn-helix domain-containing protein [Streptomyces sp. NBC_00083]|uniref:MmyB family transcriptional regulator n=1 Tax=Streptomyces sp. NBC_00083 TaxID=2975647 RepID=UPI00224F08D7|nr:helix-turn-helix domain-containing protein [Streptomyces sp. NBC_00083]MCX5384494.1 helix-turn-helix transcriptional regulator [Streptomyces sp. NBC_00083]